MRTLFFLASLFLGGLASAQQGSYTYIDQPAPYSNAGHLAAQGTPRIGEVFQVEVPVSQDFLATNQWSYSYLLTGSSNPNLDLGAQLLISGFLFSSGELVVRTPRTATVRRGITTVSFSIPNAPVLIGASFYQQVVTENGSWSYWTGVERRLPSPRPRRRRPAGDASLRLEAMMLSLR